MGWEPILARKYTTPFRTRIEYLERVLSYIRDLAKEEAPYSQIVAVVNVAMGDEEKKEKEGDRYSNKQDCY